MFQFFQSTRTSLYSISRVRVTRNSIISTVKFKKIKWMTENNREASREKDSIFDLIAVNSHCSHSIIQMAPLLCCIEYCVISNVFFSLVSNIHLCLISMSKNVASESSHIPVSIYLSMSCTLEKNRNPVTQNGSFCVTSLFFFVFFQYKNATKMC